MKKIIKVFHKIEEVVMISCLGIMGLVLAAHIFLRWSMGMPIPWAEEMARYLQVWITFIGIGYGVRKKTHVSMPMFRNMMPRTMKYIATMICDLLIIACSIILLSAAPEFMMQQNKVSSAMHIPMYIVYASIPLGFVSFTIYMIAEVVKNSIAFVTGKEEVC